MNEDAIRPFRDMANHAPVMIWVSDINQLTIWFNKPWYDFTGRSEKEELGFGWADNLHPDDYERSLQIYNQSFDARQPFSIDYRLRRRDGSYRWMMDSGNPNYATDGTFSGYIGFCSDIQDRKDLELALSAKSVALEQSDIQLRATIEKSESATRLYETILSATPDFVYIFEFGSNEHNHTFGYANEGLLKMFGRTFEETVGKTFLEIGYEPWHADLHNQEIELVRKTKQPLRGEVPFNGTNGRRIYDYIFAPVFDSNGEVEAVAGITRDVTERHETEERLKHNEEALKIAAQRKDEFLAMLAHELRNPLAPISSAIEIMALSNYEVGRVQKYSQVIDRQVKHMASLINDLLDVSRVTRGLVEIKKTPQNLVNILRSSIEQVKPLIDAKSQRLHMNYDSKPVVVDGDEKRLIQIFTNVLNNAAKYTLDHGVIEIDMNVQGEYVEVEITDNGIGISEDDHDMIFELFTQAKRTSDRSQGGLGIGLAIVKGLLDLHDGMIDCYSEGLGKGSKFVVRLPLNEESIIRPDNPEELNIGSTSKQFIVVVDDNIDAANSLAEILQLSGHRVQVEHDSSEALDLIFRSKPTVCILDIGLPDIDGNEMARRIRKNPDLANIILIAVTGYGQESDKLESLKAGFDFHYVKPVNLNILCKTIEELSSKQSN
ncbi:MAG: hypothetical protein C0490_13925 [Marivirga sp.]|nr:hypothetical protein [Marivirga sp.]